MKSLAQIEKVMLLRSVDLFKSCNAEEVVRISAIARERHLEGDEEIYKANEPADALYCVVEGQVELRRQTGEKRMVEATGTFGVREILSDRLRDASARALSPTVALAISADDFFDLLSHNIEIVRALFRELLAGRAESGGGGS